MKNPDGRTGGAAATAGVAVTGERTRQAAGRYHQEMVRSELEAVVGIDHVSMEEADRLIYSCDWFWANQMWLDRGHALPTPDYIVHPGTVQEISAVLKI